MAQSKECRTQGPRLRVKLTIVQLSDLSPVTSDNPRPEARDIQYTSLFSSSRFLVFPSSSTQSVIHSLSLELVEAFPDELQAVNYSGTPVSP